MSVSCLPPTVYVTASDLVQSFSSVTMVTTRAVGDVAEMAAQCCASRNFRFRVGIYLSLTHSASVISKNIAINHILPKTRFFGLHFCCRQYGSNCEATWIHCWWLVVDWLGKMMMLLFYKWELRGCAYQIHQNNKRQNSEWRNMIDARKRRITS